MCTSFTGESGEAQAHELAKELRTKHKLQAYIFRHQFDYTGTVDGLGMNLIGLESKRQQIVLGLVILTAVVLDQSKRK